MGLDAEFFFEARNGKIKKEDLCLPDDCEVVKTSKYDREINPIYTHKIISGYRFFSNDYPRGDWLKIKEILYCLHECHNVLKYSYHHDQGYPEYNLELILDAHSHYILNKS